LNVGFDANVMVLLHDAGRTSALIYYKSLKTVQ